jgi:hypothetical protein
MTISIRGRTCAECNLLTLRDLPVGTGEGFGLCTMRDRLEGAFAPACVLFEEAASMAPRREWMENLTKGKD